MIKQSLFSLKCSSSEIEDPEMMTSIRDGHDDGASDDDDTGSRPSGVSLTTKATSKLKRKREKREMDARRVAVRTVLTGDKIDVYCVHSRYSRDMLC